MNVDHVATLRQARRAAEPDPVVAASLAEAAGADSITVHLREDRRHVQDRDVENLRRTVRTALNLEMAAAAGIIEIARRLRPDQATLVPERREELTTEGGLDVAGDLARVRDAVAALCDAGIRPALFIDPEAAQVEAARAAGAAAVEFHTGAYAGACGAAREAERLRLFAAAERAVAAGLAVHAGHGLDDRNLRPLLSMPRLEEVNIGHSIVARAVYVGIGEAVREMRRVLDGGP